MAKVLIVEDNDHLADEIQSWLIIDKHVCEIAACGEDAIAYIERDIVDLIVLDWQLPDLSGIEVLQRFRTKLRVPVLMLTGKATLQDKLTGLNSGADDYLTKPFTGEELLARIRALLRRTHVQSESGLRFADVLVDETSREAKANNNNLKLTPIEFDCLVHLMKQVGKAPLSTEALLSRVWSAKERGTADAVKNSISQIRSKLRKVESRAAIRMRHGFGYELTEDCSPGEE